MPNDQTRIRAYTFSQDLRDVIDNSHPLLTNQDGPAYYKPRTKPDNLVYLGVLGKKKMIHGSEFYRNRCYNLVVYPANIERAKKILNKVHDMVKPESERLKHTEDKKTKTKRRDYLSLEELAIQT